MALPGKLFRRFDRSPRLRKARTSGVQLQLIVGSFIFGSIGCASPGLPKPPSLHIPSSATDLTGQRIGNDVILRWTTPSKTTDGLDFTDLITAEICGDTLPVQNTLPAKTAPALPAVRCTPISAKVIYPGAATALVHLQPAALNTANRQQLVAYRVRLINSAGHSAAPSPPVLIPGGPAPMAVVGFQAEQQKAFVVLQWAHTFDRKEEACEVVVTRIASDSSVTGMPSITVSQGKSSGEKQSATSKVGGKSDAPSVRLQPNSGVNGILLGSSGKTGGMVDQGVRDGWTYRYSAQCVMHVFVDGRPFDIESEPTAPINVTLADVSPPDPPKGLTGALESHEIVDLSWEPNAENDLAGYLVYRDAYEDDRKPSAKKGLRMNGIPIPGPSFRDDKVVAGRRYVYVVTALDRNGNESGPSSPFQADP